MAGDSKIKVKSRKEKVYMKSAEDSMCIFLTLKHFFRPLPQKNRYNDVSHPVIKIIISLTARKIICDGAAAAKPPETLRIFYFH